MVRNWYPQFAVLKEILVVEDIKLFVVQLLRVEEFLYHYFAYRIRRLHNGEQQVIVIADLAHKFPVYATKLPTLGLLADKKYLLHRTSNLDDGN